MRPLDKLGQVSDNSRRIDGTAIEMNLESLIILEFLGATRRIRTDDLLITKQLSDSGPWTRSGHKNFLTIHKS